MSVRSKVLAFLAMGDPSKSVTAGGFRVAARVDEVASISATQGP